MTPEQKDAIISMFNVAVERERKALDMLDNPNPKISARGDSDSSFALGEQSGIDTVLRLLGYKLIKDDCDNAIDVEGENA